MPSFSLLPYSHLYICLIHLPPRSRPRPPSPPLPKRSLTHASVLYLNVGPADALFMYPGSHKMRDWSRKPGLDKSCPRTGLTLWHTFIPLDYISFSCQTARWGIYKEDDLRSDTFSYLLLEDIHT